MFFVVLFAAFPTACSTTGSPPGDEPTTKTETTSAKSSTYGNDPLGTAKRWAQSPPSDTPDAIEKRVTAWPNHTVLRVYRVDADKFRAVVAASDSRDADAVLLTLVATGDNDGWTVDAVETTDATHAWPTN
ncbi:MAG: hypothetical protein ABEN55_18270 [Bradymonadaceae bacterium]